jgi:phosphoglycerate dehydrogenase-like enzyme
VSRRRPVVVVVVAPDEPDPPGLERLGAIAELRVVREGEALAGALTGADVLAVYDFRTRLVADLGSSAAEVPWIHAASAGVDAVLTPAVVAGDTVVTNAQGVFDEPIAEWVLAALLFFAKDLRTAVELQRDARWRHRESQRLAGRTLLVVGAGSIGRAVARLCGGVGMRVRGVARRARPGDADFEVVVATDDLLEELAGADDVVVTLPLTPGTRHLLDAEALDRLRPGARIVDVSRGGVVDDVALLAALRSGALAAAALDVFPTEPLPPTHPFWAMEQVLVSPHMSGDVQGWREALGAQLTDNVRRWVAGEPLRHVVDKRALAGVRT